MKRSLLVLTAAAVVLSPIAASAAPAKATKRTVTYDYTGFTAVGNGSASLNYDGPCAAVDACWDFDTTKGEKTIEIKGSAANVGFQVFSDDDYAGTVMSFCGSGKFVVSPKTGHAISVRPFLSDCGGVPTTGKFTALITGTK